MDVATLSPDIHERLRRISVGEFHRMIEAGILGEDEHVQLIAGTLVSMTPQGPSHALVIQILTRLVTGALGAEFAIRPQLPLTLLDDSEPEPDLAVTRADDARSRESHPRTALLVVEVAGDSLRLDRKSKSALYARAGIPEYWIVNLENSTVEVHRDPDAAAGSYRTKAAVASGETLTAATVPGLTINVAQLFS